MEKDLKIRITIDKKTGELKTVANEFEYVNKKANGAIKGVEKFSKKLIGIAAGTVSLYAVHKALSLTVNEFIALENAQIGVKKTTGLSGDGFEALNTQLENMSTTMDGFEIDGLYATAEAAGQLGIKGVADISEFTRVIGMVGLTTELTADVAATKFAKLSNSLNEPISNIETLASVANELSNNTSATVSDLLMFSQRLSGGAKTAGLMTDEIFGLSATMTDLAINFETGGTNINRVMLDIISDSNKFASAIGEDAEDFARVVEDEPMVALQKLLEHMNSLGKTDAANFLSDLGYSGVEVKDVLLKLASNTELLTKNLKIANDEYKTGTSIQIEYKTAADGLQSQNTKLSASFKLLSSDIGEHLKEPILDASKNLLVLTENFRKFINTNRSKQSAFEIESTRDIRKINDVEAAQNALKKLGDTYAGMLDDGAGFWQSEVGFNAELKNKEYLILSLTKKINRLSEAKENSESKNPTDDIIPGAGTESTTKTIESWKTKLENIPGDAFNDLNKISFEINENFQKINEELAKSSTISYGATHDRYIASLKEFYSNKDGFFEDEDEDENGNKKKIDEEFQRWGDTLNSSISNALVDALTSGDVMGALRGLNSSIASSMIQSSSANILAGGSQLASAGGMMSMGGLGGMGVGIGLSVLSSALFQEDVFEITEQTNFLKEIADNTKTLSDSVKLNDRIGLGLKYELGQTFKEYSQSIGSESFWSQGQWIDSGGRGNVNLFGNDFGSVSDKTVYNGHDTEYDTIELNDNKFSNKVSDYFKEKLLEDLSAMNDVDTYFNVLTDTTVKSHKGNFWHSGWKETVYTFEQMNEAQAILALAMQQFGDLTYSDGVANLSDDDMENFENAMYQIYSSFDALSRIEASFAGNTDEWDYENTLSIKEKELEYFNNRYGAIYKDAGLSLDGLSGDNITDYLNDEVFSHLDLSQIDIESFDEDIDSLADALLKANDATKEWEEELSKAYISGLESVGSTLESIISSLSSELTEPTASLENFYATLGDVKQFEGTQDELDALLSNLSTQSSVLLDSSNFLNQYDMAFAQARAKNELDGIDSIINTELNALQDIEAAIINLGTIFDTSIQSIDIKIPDVSVSIDVQIPLQRNDDGSIKRLQGYYDDDGSIIGGTLVDDTGSVTGSIAPRRAVKGFASGGYTGDYGIKDIAGLVHGQEYVVNSQTTQDLGLNNGNGGVFKEILDEIKDLRQVTTAQANEIVRMRKENQDQTALLSEMAS